jgi:hypothetical protein
MSLVEIITPSQSARIKELNDRFRSTFVGGVVTITHGVDALCREVRAEVLRRVRTFDHFNADNDPHGEHDFGAFNIGGLQFFFKISYYDRTMKHGSEDPADTSKTTRELCVMLAEEY